MADPNTGDKNRLRETLVDVQSKWHDLTELLVQMISFAVSKLCVLPIVLILIATQLNNY